MTWSGEGIDEKKNTRWEGTARRRNGKKTRLRLEKKCLIGETGLTRKKKETTLKEGSLYRKGKTDNPIEND